MSPMTGYKSWPVAVVAVTVMCVCVYMLGISRCNRYSDRWTYQQQDLHNTTQHHTQVSPLVPGSHIHRKLMYGLVEVAPWRMFDMEQEVQNDDYEEAYLRLMNRMDLTCTNVLRLGDVDDGGWDICLAGPYIPRIDNCLVYSFGIRNDWSFDDAVTEKFHCTERAFDPTINLQTETKRSEYITFYPIGLSNVDGTQMIKDVDRPVQTFPSLLKRFGEQNATIDYLKMDIDLSEWPALSGKLMDSLVNVKQLGIEFHSRERKYKEYIELTSRLEKFGFRKWQAHWNHHVGHRRKYNATRRQFSSCIEVYYLNINFLPQNLTIA